MAVLVTDSVIKQFQQDGTYQIVGDDQADRDLAGRHSRVNRAPARSVRGNVLATTEFNLSMRLRYTLVSRLTKSRLPVRRRCRATPVSLSAPILRRMSARLCLSPPKI